MEEPPRLVRSGLVLFLSRMVSVVTGLAFTIMITRNVPDVEYGVWTNVTNDVVAYFTLLSNVVPFWIIRFFARGYKDSARTGVCANLLLGVISASIYVLIVPFLLPLLHISSDYLPVYLLASIHVIEIYLVSAFQPILRVAKIETLGYGLLLEEIVRVGLGYWFIMHMGMGLQGAMLALICAFLVQVMVYVYIGRENLRGRIEWVYVKEWVKGSTANLYNIVGYRVAAFAPIMLIIVCGEEVGLKARAFYGASYQIASVINYATFLVFALYPRLLMRRDPKDVSESFKLLFMFVLPMMAGVIAFADSFLVILGKRVIKGELVDYSVAAPILRLLAPSMLALTVSQVLNSIIFGAEKFDLEARIPLKKLVRSKIFAVFTLPYIKALIVLPALYFVLSTFNVNLAVDSVQQAVAASFYFVQLLLAAEIILLIVRVILTRRMITFPFPWKNLLKYSLASTIMAVFLLLIDHPTKISTVLLYTVIAGAIYFAILLAIDEDARFLFKSILEEIKCILKVRS